MNKENTRYKFSNNPRHTENVLLQRTFAFAVEIVKFSEQLDDLKKWSVSRQILRSGTSLGANSREAQSAESRADFIHKLKIAMKEAEETEYWLHLCQALDSYPNAEKLIQEVHEIIKLLNSIITSSKSNGKL